MTVSPTFIGFSKSAETWDRLPYDWFDIWHVVRNEHGSRFAPMLKMTEYILKHTWGTGSFNGYVQLSTNEFCLGRRRNRLERFDHGTSISPNSVQSAGKALAELGLLEIEQDQKYPARRLLTYRPRIHDKNEENTGKLFDSFPPLTEDYFKVPKVWTDITTNITSAATILTVEYLFRYNWDINNRDRVWLSADEIADGRLHENGRRRYDAGTGFQVASIHRALKEALALGLVVWKERYEEGITTRLYSPRFRREPAQDDGTIE
jgi:hypothetical protein